MFHEKENLLLQSHHPHLHHHAAGNSKLAAKTPLGKAFPKTPLRVPLRDDGGGTRMPMTAKKSAFANRDLRMGGQTPAAPGMGGGKGKMVMQTPGPQQTVKRRPLGSKSANGKAREASAKGAKVGLKGPHMEVKMETRDWRDIPDTPEPYRRLAPPDLPSGPDDDFGPVPDYKYFKGKTMEGVWSFYTEGIVDVATQRGLEWDKRMEEEALAWKEGRESPVKRVRKVRRDAGEKLVVRKDTETVVKPKAAGTSNAMRPTASTAAKSSAAITNKPTTTLHKRTTSTLPPARTTVLNKPLHSRSQSTTLGERASRSTIGYAAGRTPAMTTARPPTSSATSRSRPTTPGVRTATSTSRPGTSSSRPPTSSSRPPTASSRPTTSSSQKTVPPTKPVQTISAAVEDEEEYDSELEALEELDRKLNAGNDGALEFEDAVDLDLLNEEFYLEF